MFSIDLAKIPHIKILVGIFFGAATILAPYYFIFEFARPIFDKYSTLQVILLGFSVAFPAYLTMVVYFMNIFTYSLKRKRMYPDHQLRTIYMSMMIASISVIFVTFYQYTFLLYSTKQPTLKQALQVMSYMWAGLNVIALITGFIVTFLRKKADAKLRIELRKLVVEAHEFDPDTSWKDKPGM